MTIIIYQILAIVSMLGGVYFSMNGDFERSIGLWVLVVFFKVSIVEVKLNERKANQ